MGTSVTRRLFLVSAGLGAAATGKKVEGLGSGAAEPESDPGPPPVHDEFPSQDPQSVRETVGVSHGNFQRVRELVEARPALAKAAWDWGFGDWESALGAASHTGNREIAEFLIGHGARPTLFSAAMLGQLEVVKAFVTASPGVQRKPGPHGITLLAHARAGGEAARETLEYLLSLGDADPVARSLPLSDSLKEACLGTYVFGPGERDLLEVSERSGSLMLRRAEGSGRRLLHLGENMFHPAGADAVRIVFALEYDRATTVTVLDPHPVVVARRRS